MKQVKYLVLAPKPCPQAVAPRGGHSVFSNPRQTLLSLSLETNLVSDFARFGRLMALLANNEYFIPVGTAQRHAMHIA